MIDISRNAFFDGTLEVSLDPNFNPTVGQQFTLFTFGDSASLDFSHLDLPLGFNWDLFVDNGTDSVISGGALHRHDSWRLRQQRVGEPGRSGSVGSGLRLGRLFGVGFLGLARQLWLWHAAGGGYRGA